MRDFRNVESVPILNPTLEWRIEVLIIMRRPPTAFPLRSIPNLVFSNLWISSFSFKLLIFDWNFDRMQFAYWDFSFLSERKHVMSMFGTLHFGHSNSIDVWAAVFALSMTECFGLWCDLQTCCEPENFTHICTQRRIWLSECMLHLFSSKISIFREAPDDCACYCPCTCVTWFEIFLLLLVFDVS